MNKFYEIKNFIPQKSADLYIYGEIVTDDTNWWTDEKDENLVGLQSFKNELDNLGEISDLNIYLNTPRRRSVCCVYNVFNVTKIERQRNKNTYFCRWIMCKCRNIPSDDGR